MPKPLARAVFALTVALLAAFFAWPLLQVLRSGFVTPEGRPTLSYLAVLLRDPTYLLGLRNSFLIACAATALALALGVPLAWMADRYRYPGKPLLGALLLVPLILPPFVGAIGLRQIFGPFGALNALLISLHLRPAGWAFDWLAANRFWGVAAMDGLALFPLVLLNVSAALGRVDPDLEDAARNLGCTGLRRFRRITLPLVRPGIFAGGILVFIWSFTDLGTPLVFDYDRVTPVQVYYGLKDIGGNPLPFALVAVMLAACLGLYAAGRGLFGRPLRAMTSRRAAPARALPAARAWLCTAAAAAVAFLALLPHLGVVGVALARDWYGTVLPSSWTLGNFRLALGHEMTLPAIGNSLRYAGASTLLDLGFGLGIAWLLVRSDLAGRRLLDFLAMLPLAVPGLVLAFGYLAMAQEGRLFAFLNPVDNPTALLIAAYAVRRLPYAVRSIAAGLEQGGVTLEEAAQSLGCPPLRTLRRITLPLISSSLAAAALIAFVFAILEVSDSLILAQKQAYYPVTKAILELFQLLGDGKFIASALGAWTMALVAAAVLTAAAFLGRRLGALLRP